MAAFKAGDLVRLKSGGPIMTLAYMSADSGWVVRWFDKDDKAQKDVFLPDTLEAAKKD